MNAFQWQKILLLSMILIWSHLIKCLLHLSILRVDIWELICKSDYAFIMQIFHIYCFYYLNCFLFFRIPEFDDIKKMLEDIREEGQCSLYDRFIPKVDSDEYGKNFCSY
jgi:hypothetical protein